MFVHACTDQCGRKRSYEMESVEAVSGEVSSDRGGASVFHETDNYYRRVRVCVQGPTLLEATLEERRVCVCKHIN